MGNEDFNLMTLLKACAKKKDLHEGIRLHAYIQKMGLLETSPYIASTLISMYARCGKLEKAQKLIEVLPFRDVVTWSALMAGYAQYGHGHMALKCFEIMRIEGISPDSVSYICALNACGITGSIEIGKSIHEEIMNYAEHLTDKDVVLGTALIDMYAKCGMLKTAQKVLDELPFRDVVAWSALIVGYAQHGYGHEAIDCFKQMQEEGLSPDTFTFSCILKACGNTGSIHMGKRIHEEIVNKRFLEKSVVLGNALVDMYAKCGALRKAQEVFDKLCIRDVVSWNALISAYAQEGQGHEALNYFERMQSEGLSPNQVTFLSVLNACGTVRAIDKGIQIHQQFFNRDMLEKDIVLGTALVDMYAKCGMLAKAQEVIEELPLRNVVSWSALIAGYAQQEQDHEAFNCLEWMKREGLSPNAVTLTCILKACANIGAIDKGKQIHDEVVKGGLLDKDVMIGNALVDMYAKCGLLNKARQVLDEELSIRDVATWNALIGGYALQGHGHEALKCLQQMQDDGLSPNSITFLCVLSACSRSGLSKEAQTIFNDMTLKHGIAATMEHHTCMVIVFGCVGLFENAMSVIKVMPSSDYSEVWLALLGACKKWGNLELGRVAFDQVVQLDNTCTQAYVHMANIFASAGMQEDAERLEMLRLKYGANDKKKKKKKQGKKSMWADASGIVHSFSFGDTKHSQIKGIYAKLNAIALKVSQGCSSNPDWVSNHMMDVKRKDVLCGHSDKLAIACALLNTSQGESIHIVNNMHLCEHCHISISLISRMEKRKIVVRGLNELHVFEDGECACGGLTWTGPGVHLPSLYCFERQRLYAQDWTTHAGTMKDK